MKLVNTTWIDRLLILLKITLNVKKYRFKNLESPSTIVFVHEQILCRKPTPNYPAAAGRVEKATAVHLSSGEVLPAKTRFRVCARARGKELFHAGLLSAELIC